MPKIPCLSETQYTWYWSKPKHYFHVIGYHTGAQYTETMEFQDHQYITTVELQVNWLYLVEILSFKKVAKLVL